MASLKKRVDIESEIHKQDNQKSMNDNVLLIKDIRDLREKVKDLEKKLTAKTSKEGDLKKQIRQLTNQNESDRSSLGRRRNLNDDEEVQKLRNLCDNRRSHIEMLRQNLEQAR